MNIIFIPGQSDAISLAGFKFIFFGISELGFQLVHPNPLSTLNARNLRPEQPASEAEPSALPESRGFGRKDQ